MPEAEVLVPVPLGDAGAALAPPDPEPEPEPEPEEPPVEGEDPPDAALADDPADPLPELAGVVELVAVVELEVEDTAALADAPLGTVSAGAPDVSVEAELPLPHATNPADRTTPAATAVIGRATRNKAAPRHEPSGSIRRPQCGQSFRSFCVSWSHQLQKRRFSTAHGSSDGLGASGSRIAETSSGSPVSRST